MGAVWRGTDELLNRTVAVKELLGAAEPPTTAGEEALEESRQRLMREGRIGARLQHPHVISMFDVVVHDDRPWLVMEYLPSQSLAAHAHREGSARAARGRGDRPAGGGRAGGRARRGGGAPRRQARQRAHRRRRPGEAHRLRRLPCRRRRAAHPHGPDRRHARLPVARGGPGQGADGRVGRVRPGGRRSTPPSRVGRRSGSTRTPTRCSTRSPRAPWTHRTRPARSPRCSCGCCPTTRRSARRRRRLATRSRASPRAGRPRAAPRRPGRPCST